jgi:Ca2+-binding RTX toxin-like protein
MRRFVTVGTLVTLLVALVATAAYAATITCTGGDCFGTAGADILKESSGNDQIYGRAGADEIRGYTYNGDTDILSGGRGPDNLFGDDTDTLDTVSGNKGSSDKCWITENADTGARDKLGGGCEGVFVHYYDPTPPDPPDECWVEPEFCTAATRE